MERSDKEISHGHHDLVNNASIVQYSKKQNTVESATFGAEMVAMRVARDLTVALRIKLKMFGVPIDGPADFFYDNDSVVKNTSISTSMLAKKHNSVNYHIIRESAAAGILRVAKIPTEFNKSDALTKVLARTRRFPGRHSMSCKRKLTSHGERFK